MRRLSALREDQRGFALVMVIWGLALLSLMAAAFMTEARTELRRGILELPQETGLPEGQEVTVTLETVASHESAREALRRSAGGWAEDAEELDKYLEWNRQQRKGKRPEISE